MAINEQQLSFTVGGSMPTKSRVGFSGRLFTHRELQKGEEVHVQLVGPDGEIVADGYGRVNVVQFKDVFNKEEDEWVAERIHTVAVT